MGALQFIASANTNSGNRNTAITFSSIPNTYTDLILYVTMRSQIGSDSDLGTIWVNNITSAGSYGFNTLSGQNITASASFTSGTAISFRIPGFTQTSNVFSNTSMYIQNYLSTSFDKQIAIETNSGSSSSQTARYNVFVAGRTQTAVAALNRLDIFITSGADISQNSQFYLYGINWTP